MNSAPCSFCNVMGSTPPTLALVQMAAPERGFKDTVLNMLETGECAVNPVPKRLVQAMNLTSVDAPPRIAESPAAFECRAPSSVVTGPCETVVIGRVLAVHVEDRCPRNAEHARIDSEALDLVACGFGSDDIRTHDRFALPRPTWAGLNGEGKF